MKERWEEWGEGGRAGCLCYLFAIGAAVTFDLGGVGFNSRATQVDGPALVQKHRRVD